MTLRGVAVAVIAPALLGACASVPPSPVCRPGETRQEIVEISFGRNIGDVVGVSEADFTRFLDEEVTPRFGGLTVWDAEGRWTNEGKLYKEPSKRLSLTLSGQPDDEAKLGAMIAAYEDRFHQDAVLTTRHSACVSFWMAKDRRP